MVMNSGMVAATANVSADLCQYIACNPERLPRATVLRLLFCLPLLHFRRLAFSLRSYLCFDSGESPDPHSD